MDRPLLEVSGVWKRLCRRPEMALRYALADIGRDLIGSQPREHLRDGEFWALRNIDFTIEAGEVVGMIGHNGAGKSTLINLVSGIILPTVGKIVVHTDRVAVIDHNAGMNSIETGRENAATQLALHGVTGDRIAAEVEEVAAFAEVGDFIDAPVGTYSLGMRLRLAFSIYTRLKPDLFIIDEAIGGGDQRFRNKFRTYLRHYIDDGGAMLLCSHEMQIVQGFCDRCMLLDRGRVMMSGPPVVVIDSYHELAREREAEAAVGRRRDGDESGGASHREAHVAHDARCRLESFEIFADDGGDLRPGVAVTIRICCTASEEIADVACAVEIGRGEITPLVTLVGGYPDDTFTMRPPRVTLVCRIDRLALAPGNYEMRLALSLPRSNTTLVLFGYEDSAISFAVVPDINVISNVLRGRQNIVYMPTTWEATADPAAPEVVE